MDPSLKIAFSLYNSPGAYALLLGSGISRAASIPTGWEIALDLTRKIAALSSSDPIQDPEAWYIKTYGGNPDYSHILAMLTQTSSERMALLRSYFEPTEEEKVRGIKVPTAAHRSIARLAKLGCVKVILTTNFDRLIETALEDEGLVPDVIRSERDLDGVVPIVHSHSCIVVKLHGDYRDTRIRNTKQELENYPEDLNDFLTKVLGDFGLIICGWSGTWDTALRRCLLTHCSTKFGTYWLTRGELRDEAKEVVDNRGAEVVTIESAESYFLMLVEKIEALRTLEHPDMKSADIAVASVKNYVIDPLQRIKLHDLIDKELEDVLRDLTSEEARTMMTARSKETFQEYLLFTEKTLDMLIPMLVTLGYYDDGSNASILTKSIDRLVRYAKHESFNLEFYPALIALYTCGIGALAAKRYPNLASILIAPRYRAEHSREKQPALTHIHVSHVFEHIPKDWIPRDNAGREFTPYNNYLFDACRLPLKACLPDDEDYVECFDLFEYLLSLTFMSVVSDRWSPIGCYGYRYRERFSGLTEETWGRSPLMDFVREGLKSGSDWDLLKGGFFDGSIEKFKDIVQKHRDFTSSVVARWG
jgi:hypothetical protein